MKSIQKVVSLYARITEANGKRKYERINNRHPQIGPNVVYCLHFYFNGKRTWETVGSDLNEALKRRVEREQELLSDRPKVEGAPTLPDSPQTLLELREAFLRDKKTTFKKDGSPLDPDTIHGYEIVTQEFIEIIGRKMPKQITKQDLKLWIAKKREQVSHRTVCNLYIGIACFLHFCGIDHKTLLPQAERPTPVEETPECFSPEEMKKFFFVITDERDALAFGMFLKTGPREQELANLEWADLDLGPSPVVRYRVKDGFRTKTGKSRTVPLEKGLAQKLEAWKLKQAGTRYVVGTGEDKVEGHFLRIMKEYVEQAGMNPENFWLHKLRDTFATWALRRGVDIRTVSHWLGHSSIEMTERYLAPEKGAAAQGLMNRAFSDALMDSASM
jgi:integrase/recombinase XerD